MINKAFDILNCRSKFSKKKFNLPINSSTVEEYSEFVSTFKNYILHLKDSTGKEIIYSKRNTGFIGMVV